MLLNWKIGNTSKAQQTETEGEKRQKTNPINLSVIFLISFGIQNQVSFIQLSIIQSVFVSSSPLDKMFHFSICYFCVKLTGSFFTQQTEIKVILNHFAYNNQKHAATTKTKPCYFLLLVSLRMPFLANLVVSWISTALLAPGNTDMILQVWKFCLGP